MESLQTYYPMSLLNIREYLSTEKWLAYPLQLVNLFEFFYWGFLAWGIWELSGKIGLPKSFWTYSYDLWAWLTFLDRCCFISYTKYTVLMKRINFLKVTAFIIPVVCIGIMIGLWANFRKRKKNRSSKRYPNILPHYNK
jgi:hypothetical protein